MSNVVDFPPSKLERLLVESIKRARAFENSMLDGYTPAKIRHDVPIARLARALAEAGLTFDCLDGTIIIKKLPRGGA